MSLALAPTVIEQPIRRPRPHSMLALGLLIAQEITAGILIGAMARIIDERFVRCRLSDRRPDRAFLMRKRSIRRVHGQQGAVVGNFISLLGVVLIFATNLHHLAIGAIAGSYHLIPPGYIACRPATWPN